MITRMIYPLSLRERVSYRIQKFFSKIKDRNIRLEFNKKLFLDLSRNDIGHKSIIFNGFYELDLSKTLIKLASTGGLLVDVGANYGYFSCLWASQNFRNKVVAFEASPKNIDPLFNNVRKNMLHDRVVVVPIALGKEVGKLEFDLGDKEGETGWGGITLNNDKTNIQVEVTTLDEYALQNSIDKINVLKIDTEGADTWVLYGAEKLISEKRIEHIFFENNYGRMKLLNIKGDEAASFLKKYGYSVQQVSSNDFYACLAK